MGIAGEDLSFPVCGNNGEDCYFSQTCHKLADMARALQVMTLAQGNKYKEEHFIKKQTAELRLKLQGALGSQECWGCV